jgi:hypothetical protein
VPYLHPRGAGLRIPATVGRLAVHQRQPQVESSLQDQVRQLKELVQALRGELNRRGSLGSLTEEDQQATDASITGTGQGAPETPSDLAGVTEPTPAGPITDGLRYVDAANWEAISDDVGGNPQKSARK